MSGLNKGVEKAEVSLKWDASPMGAADHDLDLVAAAYRAEAPHGEPAYLVHFDSRSPDGTITLSRESHTGQGFGYDEVMAFDLYRLSSAYSRVVVGVAIQQRGGRLTFAEIAGASAKMAEGYTELAQEDFASVADSTAATLCEFVRDEAGQWSFRPLVRGFDDTDLALFARQMGGEPG